MLCTVTYLKSPQKVDNVLIDAGSRIEAGSQIQAWVFRSLVLIEAGGFYLRFYGSFVLGKPSERINNFPRKGRGLGHVTPKIFGISSKLLELGTSNLVLGKAERAQK